MKKIVVSPFKSVKLSHRIFYFSNRDNNYFGCCSPDGYVTLLDYDFNIIKVVDCTETIKQKGKSILFFELHSISDIFYIGSEDECRVYDFDGKILATLHENLEAVHFVEGKDWLWYVKRIDSGHIEVFLRKDGAHVASIVLKDEIGDSTSMFEPLPEFVRISLTLAGGQDGMMVYFLTYYAGEIICQTVDMLDDSAYLSFNSNKDKFITMNPYGQDTITCYSYTYSALNVINSYTIPEEEIEEDNIVGYTTLYLDDKYALVEIGENIYKILDTEVMEIVADFIVEGHEPKPISYYYPTLKDEEGKITDLAQFFQVSHTLLASYRATPQDKDVDSLLMIKQSEIEDKLKEALYN